MRLLASLVVAAAVVAFAGSAFAGPCGGSYTGQTAQTVVTPNGPQTVIVTNDSATVETRK